jgi:hypothetical protein
LSSSGNGVLSRFEELRAGSSERQLDTRRIERALIFVDVDEYAAFIVDDVRLE